MTFAWHAERIDTLRKLYDENLSASEIAVVFGGGVTRNAVLGKIHRLGLHRGRPRAAKAIAPKPRPRGVGRITFGHARKSQHRKREETHWRETAKAEFSSALEATDLPADQSPFACTLAELNDETCRWPMGDPQSKDFRFCGAKPDGAPYCGRHARIAFHRVRAAA